MTRQFCDRCDADITGETSAALRVVADADEEGGGDVTDSADLCVRCYQALKVWMETRPSRKSAPSRSSPTA